MMSKICKTLSHMFITAVHSVTADVVFKIHGITCQIKYNHK
jgi:hypothetical protein